MLKQEFIDALYSSGWNSPSDAQHSEIAKLHAKIFPTVAFLELERSDIAESAHMSGQSDAGIDPSFSNAQNYVKKMGY